MNDPLQAALDERLEQALQTSNYRITLAAQMDLARLKLKEQLTVSLNGGTFYVTPNLITFIHMHVQDDAKSVVLLDTHENPVEIVDLEAFLELMKDTYHEAHNDYLVESKRIRKARTTKVVVGA